MNSNRQYFINLLSSFINGTTIQTPPQNIDWEEIYHLSKIHSTTAIVYASMNQLEEQYKPEKEIYDKFQWFFYSTIKRDLEFDKHITQLKENLEKEKIPHIFVKGHVLKNYYPYGQLRTMGDVDFLIKKEDREKSHEVVLKMNYKKRCETAGVWAYTKDVSHIEIHTDLIYEEIKKDVDFQEYFSHAWDNAVLVHGDYTYELKKEYHLIFLLVHIAKHFNYSGCGIRMIMDIAVFLNNFVEDLDWNYIWSELEKLNLVLFTKNIFALCSKWFDSKLPIDEPILEENFYNRIYDFVLSKGTFGFYNNDKQATLVRKEHKKSENNSYKKSIFKVCKYFVFLPYEDMIKMEKYSFIKDRKYLLPVAWLYRLLYTLINKPNKGFKLIDKTMKVEEEARYQYNIISELGI